MGNTISISPATPGDAPPLEQLMNAAEAEAARRNCAAVFMSVITTRTELIDWYTRHGYHDTGKRTPFAFTDPRFGKPKAELDVAVLEKEIRNSEIRKEGEGVLGVRRSVGAL